MDLIENRLNLITDMFQQENYTEVSQLYLSLIKDLKEENSPLLAEQSYDYAYFLFNLSEYELSLNMFLYAYNLGYHKEEIETLLYDSFVLPNQEEFKSTYENYTSAFLDHIILPLIPSFEELPIDFIPYEDNKYLMFNRKSKEFEGYIDISEEALRNYTPVEYADEFSDIVIMDDWNFSTMKDCILSNKNRTLYFISSCMDMTLSLLKLPSIMERLCDNVKLMDSLSSFQFYFHENTAVYLPRLLYGRNITNMEHKITAVLEEEHAYRLTTEGRNTSNVLLSIGIPSYNRGHRALQNIQSLLESQYDAEIEFVISNNGSVKFAKEYEEIKNIQDSRIQYFEFPENMGANSNFCQVLEIAKGQFTCLLSDEDSLILDSFTHYLSVLKNNPNISFAISRGRHYYNHEVCRTTKMGQDAFLASLLNSNYVSGLIYRSDLVHELDIYKWTMKHIETNKAVLFYSHTCWAMLFSLCGDYYEDNTPFFLEGSAEDDLTSAKVSNLATPSFPFYATIENRVEQHHGFIQMFNLLYPSIDANTLLTAYLHLCDKTIFLLSLVKNSYIADGHPWNTICDEIEECCITSISEINYNINVPTKDLLTERIISIINRYR
ncbi:MAG: glycosyltransferase [Mobilitalea sp.]